MTEEIAGEKIDYGAIAASLIIVLASLQQINIEALARIESKACNYGPFPNTSNPITTGKEFQNICRLATRLVSLKQDSWLVLKSLGIHT